MRRTVAMPDFQDARHIAENQAGAEDFPAEYGKFSPRNMGNSLELYVFYVILTNIEFSYLLS